MATCYCTGACHRWPFRCAAGSGGALRDDYRDWIAPVTYPPTNPAPAQRNLLRDTEGEQIAAMNRLAAAMEKLADAITGVSKPKANANA